MVAEHSVCGHTIIHFHKPSCWTFSLFKFFVSMNKASMNIFYTHVFLCWDALPSAQPQVWNCAKGVPASKVFGTCCLNHSQVFRICVFLKFFWLFLSLTFKPKIFDASWKCCLCEKYCFYLHTPQERSSYSLCTSIQLFLRIIWQRIPKAIHFWFGGLGIYPPKLSKLLSTEASVDYDNGIKLETVFLTVGK